MLPHWKLDEFLNLIRRRYPGWNGFEHPGFVADEIAPKLASARRAQALLSQAALDELLAQGAFSDLLGRLQQVSKDNNLLWRVVPSSGDTAVLFHPQLAPPAFCTQVRNLLYGDRPSPERLQTFSNFLKEQNLPNKWPFATYFLFLCHPDREMFVKPRTARWFLKFMWAGEEGLDSLQTKILITMEPSAGSYAAVLAQVSVLQQAMADFGPADMIAMQSFIRVCEQESIHQTGRLDARGQIELDVPATPPVTPVDYPQPTLATAVIRETAATPPPAYSLADCAAATGWPEAELARWVKALQRKGQAVLYGPPGTGKTFMARQLARHLTAGTDGFVELVQFHPAYGYEAFVQGIRPLTDDEGRLHYALVHGRFRRFCARAARRKGPCVLIIDEINRANLAAVFGELMYLLEYREAEIPLAEGDRFQIPANVILIGTMNTADRSIALVDHALRRRFAFIHLPPSFDVLRHYHHQTGFDPEPLIKILQYLNRQIGDPHYHIGITFFLQPDLPHHLEDIWRLEIEPYLEEYFFDQPDQVEAFRWQKISQQLW